MYDAIIELSMKATVTMSKENKENFIAEFVKLMLWINETEIIEDE